MASKRGVTATKCPWCRPILERQGVTTTGVETAPRCRTCRSGRLETPAFCLSGQKAGVYRDTRDGCSTADDDRWRAVDDNAREVSDVPIGTSVPPAFLPVWARARCLSGHEGRVEIRVETSQVSTLRLSATGPRCRLDGGSEDIYVHVAGTCPANVELDRLPKKQRCSRRRPPCVRPPTASWSLSPRARPHRRR